MHLRRAQTVFAVFGVLALAAGAAAAQGFTDTDWLMHRGDPRRLGHNGDPGLDPARVPPPAGAGQTLDRVWVWPASRDMPAEMVTDDLDASFVMSPAGSWTRPAEADRATGAWPPVDATPANVGSYVYTQAVNSPALEGIGVDVLSRLPNLGTDAASVALYRTVHETLRDSDLYARWSLRTSYPANSFQGRRDVGGQPLAANQRYALYIRFPASGTVIGGTAHPNVDHALVRVSWGADPNDPIRSRIFLVSFGETGGYWKRIRTGSGDDRYFPFDGTNPIRVTLYGLTPDNVADPAQFGAPPLVTADAVRLVPEAMRGDIHAPAASALFPPGGLNPVQLTFFARDETAGPGILFPASGDYTSPAGFTGVPLNPTLLPADPNPIVADPTSTVRSSVFYCMEDDPANATYGRLRWRYVAQSTPTRASTGDDGQAGFSSSGFAPVGQPQAGNDQAYGPTYHTAAAVASNTSTASATWTAPLYGTGTYSVMVWIPGGNTLAATFATRAHYRITTTAGDVDFHLDQRNADYDVAGTARFGAWRLLASGIRFAGATGNLTLHNDSATDAAAGRDVVADAVQFVAESQTSSSVVASPLVASVKWPSGAVRQVVYFATTGGRLWALDAAGVGGNSTLTTAYWVYPSISNPDPAQDLNGNGAFDGPQDDPNYIPDPYSSRPQQGIDGDLSPDRLPGRAPPYTVINAAPDLGPFVSSPLFVRVKRSDTVTQEYIVVGNQNGRLYAFDPAGRVDENTREPFAATIAAGSNPGVPGTTRRLMTWPTVARDKWLKAGGTLLGRDSFARYSDDASKTSFSASPSAPTDVATFLTDRLIAGAGDGHVYAVDLQNLDPRKRISNDANDGDPIWQFPEPKAQVAAITQPGALTSTGKYVFTAGGRVYAITTPPGSDAGGHLRPEWSYPYAASPGDPAKGGDQQAEGSNFTAPVYLSTVSAAFNGGREAVFVANRDGRVFAFDASVSGNPVGGPPVLWQSRSRGPTRAGATYLSYLAPQARYQTGSGISGGPAVLLPLDTGAISAVSALNGGDLMWYLGDAPVGNVPLSALDANGNSVLQTVPTSAAYRGADAITANGWMYNGDEGNQDTGEINGQMRAYARSSVGLVTPDEPVYNPDDTSQGIVHLKLVELWNTEKDAPGSPTAVWDNFGDLNAATAKSPYTEWVAGHEKPNTIGAPDNLVVYEWGDSIYVAAWGTVSSTSGSPRLPTVTFRLFGVGQARPPITVGAVRDKTIPEHDEGGGVTSYAWVAKTAFPLGRGSEADAQTPGRRYTVSAQAQLGTSGGISVPSLQLFAGTAAISKADPPYTAPGIDENAPTVNQPRNITIAHPLALTTRGYGSGAIGPAALNIIGWIPAPTGAADVRELLANGNRLYNPPAGQGLKDIVAPLGFISHGSSAAYTAADASGNRVQGLYIADRSNLYKLNQSLANVRVERQDLGWGWNPADPSQALTGNVMNPLPWESFPTDRPNVSRDYPNMDPTRAVFRASGADMAVRGATLPRASLNGTAKELHPLPIDLNVDVRRFQPANVNRVYLDMNGASHTLLAPMMAGTGAPATSGQVSASAGYQGEVLVFIDANGDGRYQGAAGQATTGQPQQPQTVGREEVFRALNVALAVPPDLAIRVEEETIDLGKLPHSAGYTPSIPFSPRGIGPYLSTPSPFDRDDGLTFFAPFTAKNEGNVNLTNLRVAKVLGNASTIGMPNFWARLTSDQAKPMLATYDAAGNLLMAPGNTDPFDVYANWKVNTPIIGRPFPLPAGGTPGADNLGIVSSLDRGHGPGNSVFDIETNYALAPYNAVNLWPFTIGNPYVVPGNPLPDWQAAGVMPYATLHKARPGDSAATVLTLPDVAYGNPLAVPNVKPRIGVAVPLGTPAGTYSAPVYAYEDAYPAQWREWAQFYSQLNGGAPNPLASAVDNDGVLNVQLSAGQPVGPPTEPVVQNPFRLRLTVREARLTNAVAFPVASGGPYLQGDGTYPQIDLRAPSANNPSAAAFGANLLPAALRDRNTGNIVLFWSSNRANSGLPAAALPDSPWTLLFSQLNATASSLGSLGPFQDWTFAGAGASATRWWSPLADQAQYPPLASAPALFPSQRSDVVGDPSTPVVPGAIAENSAGQPMVRHGSPALAVDENDTGQGQTLWLFWQGVAHKNAAGGQSTTIDARTFYVPLVAQNGTFAPNTSVNGGVPYSFLNDPVLPKYAPKPLIVNGAALLFWNGGAQGRARLYYNVNSAGLGSVGNWSQDRALDTPGGLQGMSNPTPVARRLDPADPTRVSDVDVIYSGQFPGRPPETFLTRYDLNQLAAGRASGAVKDLPRAENELLARQGASQTWLSRDLAWLYRDPVTGAYVDGTGNSPYIVLSVNGTRVNVGAPSLDNATGRLYFNSALGGRLWVDPQSGAVAFPDAAPRSGDAVTASYTPRTLRLNVTRTDPGAVAVPAGWAADAGFAPRPHVQAPGANTAPVAFMDRSVNPRAATEPDALRTGAQAGLPATTSRLWLLYRKVGSNVTAPSAAYYKTMRLMVRLPRPVPRSLVNGVPRIADNVQVAGNRGPVEIDWVRGRLYFTDMDEGSVVTVTQRVDPNQPPITAQYRVSWGDELSEAGEAMVPADAAVNEGQMAAFKDPFEDKVWLFWSSTRAGTTDLYYMTLSPPFYPQVAGQP